jgi:hypothetical protein
VSRVPRESQRFPVDLPVDVRRAEQVSTARATNASLGGCYLELAPAPALGERLSLRFTINGGHVVETVAVVRWNDDHGSGLSFDGLRARDVYALGKYFESLG